MNYNEPMNDVPHPLMAPHNDDAPPLVVNAGSHIRNAGLGWTNTYETAQHNARKWFNQMLDNGFIDIELIDTGIETEGRWSFTVRHTITGVEVDLDMHGVDDEKAFDKQNYARPRVYWNDSSCANPDLEDFAADGFKPARTYRR